MMDDTLNIATAMSETSDWSSGFISFDDNRVDEWCQRPHYAVFCIVRKSQITSTKLSRYAGSGVARHTEKTWIPAFAEMTGRCGNDREGVGMTEKRKGMTRKVRE